MVVDMLIKIPGELHGASLVKAHNWVKSHVARNNPGGTMDYSLSNPSGDRMTLSDITRNPNSSVVIEVTQLEAIRKNPTAFTPLPEMEFDYPEVPRLGNDLTSILPGEIDSALATRIIAEQGLNRGLHTLNRLVHETTGTHISSPTTAALIQISEAVRSNPRRNPKTPFTQRSPNFYNAEKALTTWVGDELGAQVEASGTSASVFTGNAKIAARYGLNKMDIQKFAKDVLSDFLIAASANRGLLRALLRNRPDFRKDREAVQKIVYMFPMKPEAFYNGRQRVFVAHPMFMYPIHAETQMTKKFANNIIKFSQNYPQNMGPEGKMPPSIKNFVITTPGYSSMNIMQKAISFFSSAASSPGDDSLQADYDKKGYWATISEELSKDMEEQSESGVRPLTYFQDIGGFYPSPPPKWPKALVYAIMDTFLENLPYLMESSGDVAKMVMSPIGIDKNYLKLQMDKQYTLKLKGSKKDSQSEVTVSGQDLMHALGTEDILGYLNDQGKFQSTAKNIKKVWPSANVKENGTINNKKDTDGAKAYKGRREAREVIAKALQKSLGIDPNNLDLHTIQYDASGPKSLLEMAYEVAETAMGKYNYKMTGDDFTFVMAMMTVSFHTLNRETEKNDFELTGVAGALTGVISQSSREELEILQTKITTADLEPDTQAKFDQGIFNAALQNHLDEQVTLVKESAFAFADAGEMAPGAADEVHNIILDIKETLKEIKNAKFADAVPAMADELVQRALNDIDMITNPEVIL
jgi:hypothetical protein